MANYTFNETVQLNVHNISLTGDLIVPEGATGLVVFSHGSGSSRLSKRNRFVAEQLQEAGFATLLFDLLTPEEDQNPEARFDIPLITQRLVDAAYWIRENLLINELNLGLFGASTGAASALGAAAALGGDVIKAVVSRGGRPDLADEILPHVKAPTLLIVGGNDEPVLDMNQQAFDRLQCEKEMEIVTGATHLFEEPGTLGKVAELATNWFKKYL
ncbi:dienelactone hydrolase family protein [Pontibacter fetidus]|uniref:Alpha/beta hydrolase n=1 Tax=Pontibacter fetidus TaxID=2700082 RepID=A0A6B2H7P2_9BACT|nr:dienelactone hydrolase family protein [Pontibacter fetidus]NDK56966.1 alpha/beta hydrolase [Pontibacter fetidus]